MNPLQNRSPWPRWCWAGVIWLGIGVFDAVQTVAVMRSEGMHHNWSHLFLVQVLQWLPWALVTPGILWLAHRFPPLGRRPATWAVHLGACASIGLLASAWCAALVMLLDPWTHPTPPGPFLPLWLDKFYNALLSSLVLYSTILILGWMLESRERLALQQAETARLNEQLSRAQLNALRRQIEPHFLFNALNAIAGLVRERRNDDAVNMIAGLSDFLRHVVADSTRLEVSLAEEMEFVERYLEIQRARFGDRVQLSIDVPESLRCAQVPTLILQPMVENAFKHGIAKRAQGGAIRICACLAKDALRLSVYNDGPALPAGWELSPGGTGIANMRTRLQGLYRDAFHLTLQNQEPDGVEAVVSLPFHEA